MLDYDFLSTDQGDARHHLIVKNLREPPQPSDGGQERLVRANIGHPVSDKNWRSEHPVLHPVSADGRRGSALKISQSLESWMDLSRVLLNCFLNFVKIERRKSRQPGISVQSYNYAVCRFTPLVFIVRRDYEKYFWIIRNTLHII